MWTNGERILYQPIDSPEVTGYWTPIRRCTDRLEMMTRFLCTAGVNVGNSTFLDIASSYGWFLSEMRKLGSEVHGIERDPVAISVGELVYGVPRDHVTRGDCVRVLRACDRRFDVVACFSILHHFALGKGSVPPEDFIRLVDQATRTVLFLDTGQCAEAWFKKSLAAWNPDFIEKWLLRNTTFTRVLRLGTDCDNIGRYKNNYGRTLFACTRAS
ncbi:MAG: class I SAM-dependent methyltransferase [Thermoguttaceae bacterium]|jgi:2-polyprenyl-3-methyl-5-hydroxy-6-metoxy-1,4-benzoquinol methylase